jgi:hypothetical protein
MRLFLVLITVCVVYLLANRLYINREYFQNSCPVDISSIRKETVIANLNLSDHYDSTDKTQSSQSPQLLRKLKQTSAQIDNLENILKQLSLSNECKNQYFSVLNIYAQNKGLSEGKAERLSSFRGLLFYLNVGSHYYLYAKEMPTNQMAKSPIIRTWLQKMCAKWSAQFKNYKNNQQLFYISAQLMDCYVNKTCARQGATSLIAEVENYHIMTNMQTGFITSEMGRATRTYSYHLYYLNALFGCLTIIRNTTNRFNWNKVRPVLQKVLDNVVKPFNNKDAKSRFASELKIENVDTLIGTVPAENLYNDMMNYLFNKGPAPQFMLSGFQMTVRDLETIFN